MTPIERRTPKPGVGNPLHMNNARGYLADFLVARAIA
jgi:hypothetical protein